MGLEDVVDECQPEVEAQELPRGAEGADRPQAVRQSVGEEVYVGHPFGS